MKFFLARKIKQKLQSFLILIFASFNPVSANENLRAGISFGSNRVVGIIDQSYSGIGNSNLFGSQETTEKQTQSTKLDSSENSFYFIIDEIIPSFELDAKLTVGLGSATLHNASGMGAINFPITIESRSKNIAISLSKDFQTSKSIKTTVGLGSIYIDSKQQIKFGNVTIVDERNFHKAFTFASISHSLNQTGSFAFYADLDTISKTNINFGIKYEILK